MSLPQRKIGSQGLVASAQGLGCMGMTAFYGTNPFEHEAQSLATFEKAVELGLNFLDTAWIYQDTATGAINEELVGKALKQFGRDKFVVATKFGITIDDDLDSSPPRIREQVEQSLQRLGTTYIDLYYQHRTDNITPIETVAETVKQLIAEGKVKYFGLSECTPSELRRAHAVCPVSAIQMEWSLQTRDLEAEVVPTARELGVGIIAYSPLGRGLLSRTFKSPTDMNATDCRKYLPRFKDHWDTNNAAVSRLEAMAQSKGCSPAQLALAWVHSRGEDVFPIPGTKSPQRLAENVGALSVTLTAEEAKALEDAVPEAAGERYAGMSGTFNTRL
eukprot:c9869_g1_i2.p1 GENE.c9869_g1_i2~~c9869_g1_i2.p1  ORF type:complete len:332 (+),score=82.78 c9869_g1_i2:2-997(+)